MRREWEGWDLLNVGREWGCGLSNRGGREKGGMGSIKAPPPYNRFPLRVGCELREVSRKKEGGM